MPTYSINAPNGKTYSIDGPAGASKEQVKARVLEQFPDAGKAAAAAKEEARQERYYQMQGGTRGGLSARGQDAFSFGLSDDVAGAATALSNAIVSPFRKDVDFDPGAAFTRGKADAQYAMDRAKREAPNAALIADVAGTVGGIALPTRALSGLKTLGQIARSSMRQGAVTGTIAGIGASDGGLGERAASAGVGALAGTGLGFAMAPVAVVTAKLGGAAVNQVRSMTGRAPSVAPRLISDALRADNIEPRAAGKIIDDAQSRGVPLALADVGDNLRGLASSVGRQPGPSRTIVRDMAVSRQEGQGDRIAAAVARDLGPVANPREVSEQLLQQAKTAAEPLYKAAYAAPMPITDNLQGILKRIPGVGVENAKRIAKIEGRDPNSLGVDFDAAGDVVLVSKPSVETLDFIKRGLDDVVEKYRDKTTGRLQLDGEGRAVNNLLREFTAEIDRVNPTYAQARAAYAGPVRASSALNKGKSFANKTADDITAETRDLSPFELDHYRLGVRAAMTSGMEKRGDYANKVQSVVGTPQKRKALAKLFGGQGNFDQFLATLADEGRAAQTYQSVAGNSLTAQRLADDALSGDSGLIEAAGNAIVTGVKGGPVSALINAIGEARRYGVGEAGKVVRAEVAAALSETDPALLRAALKRAIRDRAAVRANRAGVGVKNKAGSIGGQLGGRLGGAVAQDAEPVTLGQIGQQRR